MDMKQFLSIRESILKQTTEVHPPRNVYIKSRPLKNWLEMPVDKFIQKFTSETLSSAEFDKTDDFTGLHWGVEVGPWTIELDKHQSKNGVWYMKSSHKDELDEQWRENTKARLLVGTTVLPDECFKNPDMLRYTPDQNYGIFTANCQKAASDFAIMVSDKPVEAFDEIFKWDKRSTTFLDLIDTLDLLKQRKGWHCYNKPFILRFVLLYAKREMMKGWSKLDKDALPQETKDIVRMLDENDTNAALKIYFEVESAVFPGRKDHTPEITDQYVKDKIIRGMHHANIRNVGNFWEAIPSFFFSSLLK